ncbi:bifunctional glutamate--cysteine ligase GshA/glutathione synthetase GshB [Vallitalea pronyensis]|uniref:Glutathione biosynthesis bifunctional protein GshAB n=1 Tax=Vallitalea pronyensis TaxID=1348613 RepID=A0A8J8SH17_9FIRM|nr:bifunctional glutamate--cysteine ligase GshA/glutathione synthetase GshB [Vallitalea pronyensis]QUI23380.1 bifunctional glutamate--cysteine ligase GshA/glutathione synthetase GshB [Vallitalea pronyensis]
MLALNQDMIQCIQDNNIEKLLLRCQFGLEKENVRVNYSGKLATTPHPKAFGDKLMNPYITTDFSESQVEMITPTVDSLEELYHMLDTIQNVIATTLDNELLWPQSLPPILPEEEQIPIASYETNEIKIQDNANLYREYLANKYGRKKQMISGIHFNFSFKDSFLRKLYESCKKHHSYRAFKDDLYMKMTRNITKFSWFFIRLLGSSPAIDESYFDYCKKCYKGSLFDDETFKFKASIRNGRCGYKNNDNYYVNLDSLEDYIESMQHLIDAGELISSKEYYSVIRPKNSQGNLSALKEHGIEYLELRLLDINPLFKLGISMDDLYLIHLFMVFSLLLDNDTLDEQLFHEATENKHHIADYGRKKGLAFNFDGKETDVETLSMEVLDTLRAIIDLIHIKREFLHKTMDKYEAMIKDHTKIYSSILIEQIKEQGFIQFHLNKAKEYLAKSRAQRFNFLGYEDMELSTQILMLDAIKRGVTVKVLDRKENFIALSYNGNTEYIKQATKTSKDSYSTVLVMENKLVTKQVLKRAGIVVPTGAVYDNIEEAKLDYDIFQGKAIVIKPNNTNFGIGITIFKEGCSREEYEMALTLAFDKDETVLIETFMEGKEYRVFVIDDEVVGVLRRVPANVTGNGMASIRQLIEEKNQDPLRGKGYRKPLEKIKMGTPEEMFLKQQGLHFDSVLEDGQIVFLRENSNISTGGDSIDYTDVISQSLKEVAVKAAQAVGASIVGVDLMTKDIRGEAENNYGIIELNFNPAIHIHCYPYKGKNRKLGEKLLDLLGFTMK